MLSVHEWKNKLSQEQSDGTVFIGYLHLHQMYHRTVGKSD